jgi:hypothetical protein
MNREITIKDLQQLSAYLDGKLPEKERIQVEARLQSQPGLRDELEGLRRTRLLLRQAPKRRAPRNFFITPEMVPKRSTLRLFPVFRLASALAGLLLVVAFAGDLLFGFAPLSAAPAAAPLTLQSQPRNSTGPSESNPPIFSLGTPTPGVATGLGGGYGGGGGGLTTGKGGGPALSDTLPPTVPSENASSQAPLPQDTPGPGLAVAPTSGPSSEAGTPPSIMSAAPQNSQPAPTQAGSLAHDQYQSGPVLGINPTEGAAEATQIADFNHAQSQPIELPRPTLHIVEGALALLAVLAGLAAFFFHRRESL